MVRQFRSATLAAVAAAALLVSACGGDDSGSSDDKIEGAEKSSPAASPSAPDGDADAPEIKLPQSVELVFEDWESENPEEQAVLDSGAQRQRATYEAITQDPPNPNSEYIPLYNMKGTGAWTSLQDWIGEFKDANATVEGTFRFFDPEVKVADNGFTATLRFCSDERDVDQKNRETGKVLTQSDPYEYVEYRTTLQKNDEGVWQTADVTNHRDECNASGLS
ncbi:hypothetical protein OG946_26230 [Streptomyces sp. NBC_01808]|uniref:hypothetical protein n=1 Tax=Streptomyces sp. NBC_01808 TaxID=2975947 RepID=UPI002DD820A3|nr:hypothetical protein [Streptomyces sp. NBC_01808]WSA40562.1 hypothetical protein OG946_26230 [Streptomyces sp. NBC_01808]